MTSEGRLARRVAKTAISCVYFPFSIPLFRSWASDLGVSQRMGSAFWGERKRAGLPKAKLLGREGWGTSWLDSSGRVQHSAG